MTNDEVVKVAAWIRANGGYFGMEENDANAMADAYADQALKPGIDSQSDVAE